MESTAVWSDVADTAVLVCITPRQEGTKQKLGRSEVNAILNKTREQLQHNKNDLLILSPTKNKRNDPTNLFSLSDDREEDDDNTSSDSSFPPRIKTLPFTSSDDDKTPHSSSVNSNQNDHSVASSTTSTSSDDHIGSAKENDSQYSGCDTEEEINDDDDESLVDIDLEESLRRRRRESCEETLESDKDDLMNQISKALQQTIIPSTESAKQSLDQIGKTTKQSMNQLGKLFLKSPLQQIPKGGGGKSALKSLFASPTSKKQAMNCKLLEDLPTLSDTDDDSMDDEINKGMNANTIGDEVARPMKEFGEQNEIPLDLSPQFIELQRTMERQNSANYNYNQLRGSIRILDSILSLQDVMLEELPDFKPHFEMVLTELQRTASQQRANFFQQGGGDDEGDRCGIEEEETSSDSHTTADAAHHYQEQETANVLANLVAAASADREALVSLTETVHRLAEQIEAKDKEIADLRSELRTGNNNSSKSKVLSISERSK